MLCIHGLDESECPICRINRITIPPISATLRKNYKNKLKAESPYFKKHLALKNDFENNLINRNKFSPPIFADLLPRINGMNFKPRRYNTALLKKLDKHSLEHLDKFDILKKVELKKPEFDLESKD